MPQVEPQVPGERRRGSLNDPLSLLVDPKISDERSGPIRVLSVDGLCVALVERDRDTAGFAERALLLAMKTTQAPTGTIFVSRGSAQVFDRESVRRMAEHGISVRYAISDDLTREAEEMIAAYWSRRKVVRSALMDVTGSEDNER